MEQLTSEEKKEIRKLKLKIALMQIAVFSVKAFNVIKRIVIFIFTLAFQVIKLDMLLFDSFTDRTNPIHTYADI